MKKEEIKKKMMSVVERLQAVIDLIDRGEYGAAFLITNHTASDVANLNCEIKATAEEKLREEIKEVRR